MAILKYTTKDCLNLSQQPLAGTSLHNYLRILYENGFRIRPSLLPRALYVAGMIGALSPLRIYERLKYDREIKKCQVKAPLFILGHFRSGTTFLHYLLGQDTRFGYISTFETMTPEMMISNEKLLRGIIKKRLPAHRPMDSLEMDESRPYEEEYAIANLCPYSLYHGWYFPRRLRHYIDRDVTFKTATERQKKTWKKAYTYYLQKIAYKNPGKRILTKSPVNTAKVKEILELYPDAKILHICRDPYKVFISTMRLYEKILPIFSFQNIDSEELEENVIYAYKETYNKYFKEKHLIPKENLIEITYEDFVASPLETLEDIYKKLDLGPIEPALSAFNAYLKEKQNYKASKQKITLKKKEKIYSRWRSCFKTLGYPQ